MGTQISFTKWESDVKHAYRDMLRAAQNASEVRRVFQTSLWALLAKATEEAKRIAPEDFDINIDGCADCAVQVGDELKSQPWFQQLWTGSDLSHVAHRLAEPAAHKIIHLQRRKETGDDRMRRA